MPASTTIRGNPMSLLIFLTVTQAIIAALLVGVILMQKSEGGGLGTGGSPAGLMSARGAADFMTRLTTILAVLFVSLSIVLAALATQSSGNRTIDDSLDRSVPVQQAPVNPLDNTGALAPAPAPAPAAPATK
jgi:preprotein translocase subunit SecG